MSSHAPSHPNLPTSWHNTLFVQPPQLADILAQHLFVMSGDTLCYSLPVLCLSCEEVSCAVLQPLCAVLAVPCATASLCCACRVKSYAP